MLTSALIEIFASTTSVHPSALSESTSCIRTGYNEDTKRIADVNSAELADKKNTIFPDFWEFLEHAQTVCTRLSFPPMPFREPGYKAKPTTVLTLNMHEYPKIHVESIPASLTTKPMTSRVY